MNLSFSFLKIYDILVKNREQSDRMLKDFLLDNSEKNNIKKQIYKYIHLHRRISKIALLQAFNLPQTTLTRIIYDLQDKGFIYNDGTGEPSGGRPPTYYAIVPNAAYVIGIDISRTHVTAILTNILFEEVEKIQYKLHAIDTPEKVIPKLIFDLKNLLIKYKIKDKALLGIGIGSVGPLDREKGIILNPDSFVATEWNNVAIVEMLNKEFSLPITLNNGANTAAYAEYYLNSLLNDSILFCINGYGVRTGFLESGVPGNNQAGDSSAAGHIVIDINGKDCICGKKGCLAAYTTYKSLLDEIVAKKDISLLTIEDNAFDFIMKLLKNNDLEVQELVLQSAYYYGVGISNMINILHPSKVFLHGKLIYQYPAYYEKVVQTIKENINITSNIIIQKSKLGEKSVALGGAIEIYNAYFK
ncbi:ROK family protein [Niallia circulans]|uniref:ROK family protein n=1 Tax=Niallia circulans TaxID=1397 RepID=A0A553STY7_NIACI|nr:ROK family protein [Niallia circulans]TRZ40457.1 ROK family protein [Niallia circulans]